MKRIEPVNANSKSLSGFLPGIYNGSLPSEIAQWLEAQPENQHLTLFNALTDEQSPLVFEYLAFSTQKRLLHLLPTERITPLLNALAPDDRTALLEELSPDIANQLIKYLSPKEREVALKLLGYREDSVGRLMTPDYLAIKLDWSVGEVLEYIQKKGSDRETLNVIYAVDDEGHLIDDFPIRRFLLASLDTKVSAIADHTFLALRIDDDEERAIMLFRKHSRVALPVIDSKGIMQGIVTIDDILHVSVEKDTEDFQKIGGVNYLKESYLRIPFLNLMKKRAGWLTVLFLGELLTASAMALFQNEISKAVVLVLFLPLIISSGGNAGSQASTLIIRAIALGEVVLKDVWVIVRRELYSGFFLGALLGSIGFLRITLWSLFSPMYGEHWLLIAFTLFFSLLGVVLWGTLTGALFPLLLKRLGADPAAASAPFVATLVDVAGLIIYFTIALLLLQGTLL